MRRYAPQYAAAGDDTLIDGLRGNQSFKTGRWQGYLGTDLDVTLDFGAPREIRHVSMGFLQDTGSWILMPRRISVQISDDDVTFRDAGAVDNSVSERESAALTRDFVLDLGRAVRARLYGCMWKDMANCRTGIRVRQRGLVLRRRDHRPITGQL